MSKYHLKSPPALYFSGALSATLQNYLQESLVVCAFPEHTRPFVKSPNFVEIKKGKGIWQEQSLT